MRIVKHIVYFYLNERIPYINRILEEADKYPYETDVYLHTNNMVLRKDVFQKYSNGEFHIIHHNLINKDPYSLTEKPRPFMALQRDMYDIFIYLEDDILIPTNTISYWLRYEPMLTDLKYNLGFLRIETSKKDGREYVTDLYQEKMDKKITIGDKQFCINDKNPYCACWIYSKKEFERFVDSRFYNIKNMDYGEDTRAACAAGLHGRGSDWYKCTVIPLINGQPMVDCKIYHLANNYVDADHSGINKFGTILFDECFRS